MKVLFKVDEYLAVYFDLFMTPINRSYTFPLCDCLCNDIYSECCSYHGDIFYHG